MPLHIAAALGRETVDLIRSGGYVAPSGRKVDLRSSLEAARHGTVEYPPEKLLPARPAAGVPGAMSVENLTVLEVGRRMAATGPVAALNCASGTMPGGNFLHGAIAQEESIARSSGLFHCLKGRQMYERHQATFDPMYSDYVIHSPNVPVFRTDDGHLLEEPWHLSVLTSAAVNGDALRRYEPERESEIPAVMRARTARLLTVAAEHAERRLILGAWGCGAFELGSEMIAGIFFEALTGPFAGAFDEVVFAIADGSEEQRYIGPFQRAFSST